MAKVPGIEKTPPCPLSVPDLSRTSLEMPALSYWSIWELTKTNRPLSICLQKNSHLKTHRFLCVPFRMIEVTLYLLNPVNLDLVP